MAYPPKIKFSGRRGRGTTLQRQTSFRRESTAEEAFQGEALSLRVESVAPGGKALARNADGRVVFVDLGVPGQEIRAGVIRSKSGYLEARRLEVLKRAPDEEEPFCEYFGRCGGCVWQEIPYALQLELKRAHILESLTRLGGLGEAAPGAEGREALESVTAPVLPSPLLRHFRGKIELVFGEGPGETPLLGFRRLGGHEVVDIAACPIADARLPELLKLVKDWAKESGLRAYGQDAASVRGTGVRDQASVLRFLVLRTSRATGLAAAELITAPAPQAARRFKLLGEKLLSVLPWLESFTHSVRRDQSAVAFGEEILLSLGAPRLRENLAGFVYELSPAAFFQTNPAAAETLVGEAVRLLAPQKGEIIWDLYCGVGAFSFPLASSGAKVMGLEANSAAVADARHNAALNNLMDCVFLDGDAGALLRKSLPGGFARPDAVLADPPRAGLHPNVVAALLRLKPARILLVSCHLATLARDLGAFSKAYVPRAVQGVDLFPHSAHVETLCLLTRRDLS